jgi:hypothetical protein
MSAVGLTNTDLSIHDNLVQARWELRRADSATTLAAWADRWGEAALDAAENPEAVDELDQANKDANEAERVSSEMAEQRSRALDALERTDPDKQSAAELGVAIDTAIGILSE